MMNEWLVGKEIEYLGKSFDIVNVVTAFIAY